MSDLLHAALAYAAARLPVFPVEPGGKAPAGRLAPRGFKDATTDAATVRGWWAAEPSANVGVRTGDGLAVLDVDAPDGPETLDAYMQNVGARLPVTAEVATGGDGWQRYFAAPSGLGLG